MNSLLMRPEKLPSHFSIAGDAEPAPAPHRRPRARGERIGGLRQMLKAMPRWGERWNSSVAAW